MPVQITPAALLHFATLAVTHRLTEDELTHALRTAREARPTGAVVVATVEAAVMAALATRAGVRVALIRGGWGAIPSPATKDGIGAKAIRQVI